MISGRVPPLENVVLLTWKLWYPSPPSCFSFSFCAHPVSEANTRLIAMTYVSIRDFMLPPLREHIWVKIFILPGRGVRAAFTTPIRLPHRACWNNHSWLVRGVSRFYFPSALRES